MAFTINDYYDLIRLLDEHPSWEAELRKRIVPGELLSLPEIVRQLAQQVAELATQVRALSADVQSLTANVQSLTASQQRLVDTVGGMKGKMLEIDYTRKVGAYFGPLVKKPRLVEVTDLDDTLEKVLSPLELNDLYLLDLLVKGRVRLAPERDEVLLAVEVSSVVDADDVARAERRAEFLRRAGYHVIAIAAGESATEGARKRATGGRVVLLQDGNVFGWEEAVRGNAL